MPVKSPAGVPAVEGVAPKSARADFASLSDAEIMLRAGAGDSMAFDYLVEK